jgi:glycosyltransferase involved in cell wall biosynthesis
MRSSVNITDGAALKTTATDYHFEPLCSTGSTRGVSRQLQNDPKSMLCLITGLTRGGAETQLVLLMEALTSRGWNVQVVTMVPGGALQADLLKRHIKVSSLGMYRGIPDPRGVTRLLKILHKDRPAILHMHMVHANLLGRFCGLFASVPVVISTVHTSTAGRRLSDICYRLSDSLTDITTIISKAAAERYISMGAVPARRLRVIPNGVPVDHFQLGAEVRQRIRTELEVEGKFVWLAVGRFEAPKDYPNLLNAMSRFSAPHNILLIAGDGPLRPSMERLADTLGISNKVHFLGIRTDVPDLMSGADAYVMSSAWEGLPMGLLEAGASALPIVATDVGGNHEIVRDGISGTLVPAKNPGALAEAMRRIEEQSVDSRRSLGLAGREHVEKHYSLSSVVDQWEQLYESLLQRKLASPPPGTFWLNA